MSGKDSSFLSSIHWEGYHVQLNKVIFGVALLGVLLTVHLAIQEQRGFAEGCTGFEGAEAGQTFNCAAVLESDAAALFGVSNIWWGFLFYSVVAGLSFAVPFVAANRRALMRKARAGLVLFGVLYSGYLLFYQFAQIGEFCLLCLISAVIALTLFGLVLAALVNVQAPRGKRRPRKGKDVKQEASVFFGMFVALLLFAGADYAYFGTQSTPDFGDEVVEGCAFDPEMDPLANYQQYVSDSDIYTGNPDSDVIVMEFFDPNCPACRMMHPIMNEVVRNYSDQALFVFKPMPLWEHSINQVQALFIAAQQGEFFSLLSQQYQHQQQQGLSDGELIELAGNTGLDVDEFASELQQGRYRGHVMTKRQEASAIGVPGTPTIIINGRFVHNQSRTADCLGAFIEAASS